MLCSIIQIYFTINPVILQYLFADTAAKYTKTRSFGLKTMVFLLIDTVIKQEYNYNVWCLKNTFTADKRKENREKC